MFTRAAARRAIMAERMATLEQLIADAARAEGFDLAGIAPAAPLAGLEHFPAWIAAGGHGEMHYLAAENENGGLKRAALANVAPWARSVIVCAMNYNSAQPYSTECTDRTRGWISRYAWSHADYHDVVLARLRRLEAHLPELLREAGFDAANPPRTWCYVDTGPVVERVLAQHAGIGWTGKNTCIINQRMGSWLFLGVILTSIEIAPSLPAPDRCGTCTRCLDACPTQAFPAPRELDATRCTSYLTIEKRGPIAEALRPAVGRHLFGCDICQDVCPWNRRAPAAAVAELLPRTELVNPALDWISGMKVEEFRSAFRGSPVKRARYAGLLRNACIAMGNSGDARFVPRLRQLAAQSDPEIAGYARWALARLRQVTAKN